MPAAASRTFLRENNRMKILVAAPGFDSREKHEVNIFALDQAKALRGAGHDVRFAAVDTRSIRHARPFGFQSYMLDGIGVYYGAIPCGALPLGLPALAGRAAASGIWRAVAKDGWKPDVIHLHFGFDLAAIAEREKIPVVFTEHSSHHNRALSPEQANRLKEEYTRCAAVLAVSRALAEAMRANTGVEAAVVPNIVDTARFAPKRTAHERFTFVSAGNLIPVKNMAGLLRAFAALDGEPKLVIFGDGTESGALRALCAGLGLEGRVSFRGHCPREELAEAYAAADCFVLASRSETFGVAYIEAMASGLPVIATRCGGPEDFVTEKNGLLVPVDDERALTAAMERMMRCRAEYDGAAIAAEAKERFSPEKIAAQLTAVYEEVISC